MATYTTAVKTMARGAWPHMGPKVGMIENTVDLAGVNSGSLADADVITALSLPAACVVLAAGMEVVEAVAGAAQCVLDLGTGDDADQFVDGSDTGSAFDIGTSGSEAAVGTYSDLADPITSTVQGKGKVLGSADTVDITVQALTGAAATLTAGQVRVWALVMDVDSMAD